MLKRIPHTYVIVFLLIILSAILTWIIPGGTFERQIVSVNGIDRSVVIPGSFHEVNRNPQTWQIFSALFEGFVERADIIAFILIIGGAFWIMNESKAIDVAILSVLRYKDRLGGDRVIFLIIMLMFSIFGAVFGMSEETIAFVIIFVPLAIRMGYDSIVGVSLCFVAAGLGFAGAILNPFTIGIAQGLSNLPLFSGIGYRMICWLVINIAGFWYVLHYASVIRRNPALSPVREEDKQWVQSIEENKEPTAYHIPSSAWITFAAILGVLIYFSVSEPLTIIKIGSSSFSIPALPVISGIFAIGGFISLRKSVHFFILQILLLTILILITGVMGYGWYIKEIATLFFAMGLVSGVSMNYSPNRITKLFLDGIRDIQSAAIIVGLAGGIIIILNNGNIIDTILYRLSESISGMGKMASISMMYVVQNLINLVMPSGSAKAALTMPVMSQFSDMIGLSRQAAVMAYQLGDGFTNMITPVSGVLLGVLSVAKIPYEKWFRWVLPLMIILIVLGFLLLIPTVYLKPAGF
jgi:uncharacterized ion transporter superfamily protein YfcC